MRWIALYIVFSGGWGWGSGRKTNIWHALNTLLYPCGLIRIWRMRTAMSFQQLSGNGGRGKSFIFSEGLFTRHRGHFRAGVSSLRFPLMALHLFTWYHHKKMSCRRESSRREFTPVVVPGREFHSGTKSRNGIMQTRNDHKFRCEISLLVDWNG